MTNSGRGLRGKNCHSGGLNMIKSFTIGRRKPGLTREEYLRYWNEKHAPLAAKVIPGLRKYIQNHAIEIPGYEFDIDGITEMWWDNLEALQNYFKWREQPEAKVLLDDEKKFSDPDRKLRFFAIEHEVLDRT
jgi:uncharacterized protein (TIGR02118 family)